MKYSVDEMQTQYYQLFSYFTKHQLNFYWQIFCTHGLIPDVYIYTRTFVIDIFTFLLCIILFNVK